MKTKILTLLVSLSLLACSERENNPANVRSTLERAEAPLEEKKSALFLFSAWLYINLHPILKNNL